MTDEGDRSLDRRRMLKALGAAALPLGLAGCSGDGGDGGSQGTEQTETSTEYTDIQSDAAAVPGGAPTDTETPTNETTTNETATTTTDSS